VGFGSTGSRRPSAEHLSASLHAAPHPGNALEVWFTGSALVSAAISRAPGAAALRSARGGAASTVAAPERFRIFHATLWAIDLKRRRQWRDGPLAAAYR